MALKDSIRKYALQNAIKYGKANAGAVIGKLFAEDASLKANAATIAKDVQAVIKEISKMKAEEMTEELKKTSPELLEEKKHEKERELHDLKNAIPGKVVMRFEPSPSGFLHIGHAYVLGLNYSYVKRYKGKLILRIGDTNPEKIDPKAYELLYEDAQWLTKNGISEMAVQSDRLEIYYNYMERLLNMGKAYVCICEPEKFKEELKKCIACPCRELGSEEHMQRWKKMFKEYKEGDAVVRIKTDISHKNPAMRDFPVFRICDTEHSRQKKKYRVWPLMNMSVTCDDIEMGVTHTIRAKEHADNAKRQEYIYNYLGKKQPEAMFVGRINFEDMPVSKTKTSKAIKEGKYTGWDDIRLPFLKILKKRGYQPDAFIKYAIDVGMSLTDKTVSKENYFKSVNAFNREIIDPISYRYFFVWEPVKVKIEGSPKQNRELDLHPDNKKGGRKLETHEEFFITQQDYDSIKPGKLYRLMDCLNFEKKGKKLVFHSKEYENFKEAGEKIMHWVPAEHNIKVEVLMDDNTIKSGVGELPLKSVKAGQIVQLERFGFCRLEMKDKKTNDMLFWYGHK